MISRRALLAGIAASAAAASLPVAAVAATEPVFTLPNPWVPRGHVVYWVNDIIHIIHADGRVTDPVVLIEQRIFDGDKWLPLNSEEGWKLYIEQQYEADPYALE